MYNDIPKKKLIVFQAIWDNGDGTVTSFKGTGKSIDFSYEPQSVDVYVDQLLEAVNFFKEDNLMKVTIELIPDASGKYGHMKKGSIPVF